MRTWTDEQVAAYKTHTEEQLRKIISDRDATIVRLRMELAAEKKKKAPSASD